MVFIPSIEAVFSCSDDCSVKLWSLNGEILKSFGNIHREKVNSVCLMSNGKTLLSGGRDGVLVCYEIGFGGLGYEDLGVRGEMRGGCEICMVSSFYNNSTFALVGGVDGALRIWHIGQRQCLHEIRGHRGFVNTVLVMTCLTDQPDIFL